MQHHFCCRRHETGGILQYNVIKLSFPAIYKKNPFKKETRLHANCSPGFSTTYHGFPQWICVVCVVFFFFWHIFIFNPLRKVQLKVLA